MKKQNKRTINKRAIIVKTVLAFVALNLLLVFISLFVNIGVDVSKGDNIFPSNASLLGFDTSSNYQKLKIEDVTDSSNLEYNSGYGKKVLSWTTDEKITFNYTATKAGKYYIALDYYSLQENVTSISINADVNNDEYTNIELQTSWTDANQSEVYDIYRNQVIPVQTVYKIWRKVYLYDQRYYGSTPLVFDLVAGENEIEFTKTEGNLLLGDIFIIEAKDFDNYQKPQNQSGISNELITLEAENALFKSTPEIRADSVSQTHLTPYSTKYNKLNVISGDSFNESGYSITYAFNVEKAGNYNMSFKYYISQTNTNVYTKIFIDNVILNKEMNNYKFKASSGFKNETLSADGEAMEFYLTSGIHTLTIQLDASLQSQIYFEMSEIINEISALYLEVVKLTGGNVDKNKHWNIERYIPTAKTRLTSWKERIASLMELTEEVSKSNSKNQNRLYQNLGNAYKKISSLESDPNTLPHKLNILSEGSSSAAKMLSNSLHTATFSPLSLDKIYIHTNDVKLPKAKSNFFVTYMATAQKIIKSGVDTSKNDDTIEIWVNRSTYYVSLMQQYADAYYTPATGKKIRFSLLPDESKITYANASGTNPDAALGVTASVPYDLGIRGALVDLKSLDGFDEVISEYAPGSFTNMMEGEKVYGLPETQDFNVTFYRSDLMQNLGISVPQTYDEIIEILPELQRYGMNYYIPMAGGSGLKSISMTAPFIYQYGGDIYSKDYMTTAIDSQEAIAGINMMVELFSIYSLPLTSQNFYDSFRNGLIPIGVAGFDVYLQLLTAAPEIAGKWDIALAPGVKKTDGTINRTNTGAGRGVIIFEKGNKQQEAWDFIKWWLSSDTQSSFANDIEASYGQTFLWNTANLEAFKTLSISKKHIDVILEQWEQLYQVPQIPATYIVERGISNAWNSAVFDQVSIRAAITDQSIEINKEIRRKMVEFKYLRSDGTIIKEYYIPSLEEIEKWMRR